MYRRNIYIMYFISLLQGLVFYAPIATLYRQAQGVTIFQITLIESISMVLWMVMELPWGILADRIGYKKTILVCNVLYFLSKIVFWKADSFGCFLLERVMLSVVCAGLSGVDMSILYLSCAEGESQKVFGIHEGLGTVGLLTTSFVYSVFIKDNYSMSGFLTVISYGIAMVLSFFLIEVRGVKESKSTAKEFAGLLKGIWDNKNLLLFLLAIAVFNETHQTITVFLSQLQYEKVGISNSTMGLLYGLITVIALCSFLSDRITKRVGEHRTMRSCFGAAVISCLILALSKRPLFAVFGVVLLRLGFSIAGPLQQELQNRQVRAENRATVLSVNSVFMSSVGVGTNIIFGALSEYSLVAAFGFGMCICLIAWGLYEIWNKKDTASK